MKKLILIIIFIFSSIFSLSIVGNINDENLVKDDRLINAKLETALIQLSSNIVLIRPNMNIEMYENEYTKYIKELDIHINNSNYKLNIIIGNLRNFAELYSNEHRILAEVELIYNDENQCIMDVYFGYNKISLIIDKGV